MHLRRGLQPQVCLKADVDRHSEEEHGVEGRCQDFEAVIAKGPLGVGRLLSHPDCHQRNCQRCRVREHVSCVRDERQTLRHDACNELHNQKGRREPESNLQGALVRARRMAVTVVVTVS